MQLNQYQLKLIKKKLKKKLKKQRKILKKDCTN